MAVQGDFWGLVRESESGSSSKPRSIYTEPPFFLYFERGQTFAQIDPAFPGEARRRLPEQGIWQPRQPERSTDRLTFLVRSGEDQAIRGVLSGLGLYTSPKSR